MCQENGEQAIFGPVCITTTEGNLSTLSGTDARPVAIVDSDEISQPPAMPKSPAEAHPIISNIDADALNWPSTSLGSHARTNACSMEDSFAN